MSTLYVLSGPERGRSFTLREGANFVGRSLDNDIRIEDRTVSRKHLRITKKGDSYFLTDLRSRNGTFFEGAYLEPGADVEAKEGVPIALGMSVICLGEECEEQITSFQETVEISREAIEKSGTLEERREETAVKRMAFLHRVSDILVKGLPIREALEKVLDQLFDFLIRIDRGAVILLDPETREIKQTVSRTNMPRDENTKAFSKRVVSQVIADKKPLLISNVQTEQGELVDTLKVLKIECVMCVPMVFGSQIFGVLYVDSMKRPYGFREEDIALLRELGQQIGLVIEKAMFVSEISKAADTLTSDS
jgi:3',5'-cyclic-nucleotide phosphodiesterase